MSEVAGDNPIAARLSPHPQPPAPPPAEPLLWKGKSRGLLRQVMGDTLTRWGAWLGAVWICLLAFVGIFAPFIANSHPYIMKVDGEVSYPLFRFLTPTDVTLLVLIATAAVLFFLKRFSPGGRLAVLAGVAAITVPLSLAKVDPPKIPKFQQYRALEERAAQGGADAPKIDYIIRAPLPYSAEDYLRDRPQTRLTPPRAAHWMGTEINGADILSRLIHASRTAMAIGFVSTGIAVLIGVTIGSLMGYFAKTVDMFGMRLVEIFEAIPSLFLIITFVAFFGHDIMMIMVILGVTSWTGYARFVRAEFLKLRQQDFVVAARACGLPLHSILFKHMLPNGMAPVLVGISFSVGGAIQFEAILSFLGLGPVGEPSWGSLLQKARESGQFYWWVGLFPGLAIFLTVFSYNLIGEALRDAIDPHTQRLKRG